MATIVSLVKNITAGVGSSNIRDITAGIGDSAPSDVLNINGVLYFVNGTDLWKIEGNTTSQVPGVKLKEDINQSVQLAAFNNTLYFVADDGMGGTKLATVSGSTIDFVQFGGTAVAPDASSLAVVGNLYFTTGGGTGLSRTDGTTTSSITGFSGTQVSNLIAAGTDTYFTVDDSVLYRTNGTSSVYVSDTSYKSELAVIGNTLYFTADASSGTELWKTSNGTTALVQDINPGIGSSFPSKLTAIGNTLYFTANNGANGTELWKTEGTTTSLVKDINPGGASSNPANLTAVGNTLYFTATSSTNGTELWKTDGTITSLVKDINLGVTSSNPADLTAVGNTLYFTATDPSNGKELWKTDSTTTSLVKDINPGGASSNPANLTALGNTLYFTATNSLTGKELWKTDGTTTLVKDINLGITSSNPANLTAVGNTLYFDAEDAANGRELRKLTPNTAPVVSNAAKVGDSSGSFFTTADFTSHFTDADPGDTLTKIKITALPASGTLSIGTTSVIFNQELTYYQLAGLIYTPKNGYSGTDSFSWSGFDGEEYAKTSAIFSLTTRATPLVITPPVITPPVVTLPFTTNNIVGNRQVNVLRGGSANDRILGKGSNDRLIGGSGNDILIGGKGNDLLTGGAGADCFVYTGLKNAIDVIKDFNITDDHIVITGSRFGGLTAGALSAGQFQVGTAANDSNDRFIYNQSRGRLSFDSDGIGGSGAVELVEFKPNTALTAGNFVIV